MSSIPPRPAVICAMALAAHMPFAARGLESFPPAGMAANDHVYVVPVEVESTSASPASITLRLHKTTHSVDVYRKSPASMLWGALRATIPAGTSTWTDTDVTVGTDYEYRFHATGLSAATESTNVRTYVMAGINVDRTASRGRVVLVMPSSIQTPLAAEIARFKRDLVGDGWTVHDVLTPDGRDDWTDAADGHHVAIRDEIIALYNAHPGEVKHVILLGRVPQPRSGLRAAWAPDGHSDLGAVAADCYYADVDNTWTDTGEIAVPTVNESGSVRTEWRNVPGDGRFDQSHFRHLTEAFEMGWGRIDFRGAVNGGYEIGALRNYLDKLHRYKHAQAGFRPGRRSLVIDSGSLFKNVQEEFWKTITPLSGLANLDYITGASLPITPGQPEAQYTFENGPYLYAFSAGNEPNQPSDNSRAVFWTGFKSYVGYHDINSWTRSRLAEPNSWTLSWTFAPPRGRYLYHRMGLGGVIGDMMRATINNQDSESGLYGSAVKNYINGAWTVQNPSGAPNDYSGFTFHGHMGDPTLRDQMIASPPWVRGRLVASGSQVQVEWLASPDATHGYDIYSATSEFGPYTKRNASPPHVNATTGELTWTDSTPPADPVFYMVRARKLETTPSGSYLNASVGRIIEVDRTPAAFTITTTTLPKAYLHSAYSHQLATTGGNPPATWSLTAGTLPAGLSLSASGLISGTPTNAGSFSFTVQATDLQGVVQSVTLTLDVDMFSTWSLLPNGDLAVAPQNTGTVNQLFSGNWQHPAAPNSQWDYDATNKWATTSVDGRTGAQPGIVYVITDNASRTGTVSFRFDLKNTDGSGKPNLLYLRIYGINGNFSWDHWNAGSNPTGNATLLHIEELSGHCDWTTFETSALPVGGGYQYYVLRFFPANVTAAEGDLMTLDNISWSAAAPPPVFYNITFVAGPGGSLTGSLSQDIAGGGSTSAVSAVAAEGYEFVNWTWPGGGSSTANPLILPNISANLAITANFQLFNQPPVSIITSPANNASYLESAAILFSGTGSDTEDGAISSATWTSSIDGPFVPSGGTFAGLSIGSHTITRTVTDSGGKSSSSSITLTIRAPGIFSQNFNASAVVADYMGSADHRFDFLGTDTSTNNRASLSITNGRLRNTVAYTNDGNTNQLSSLRLTRRTNLPIEDNFAVVSAKAYLAPQSWPSGDTTYLGFVIGQNFRSGIFNPVGGTGNGPAFASLNIQARATANTFRTTGVGGNSTNFTVTPSGGVFPIDLVVAANSGTNAHTFPSPTGDHTVQPGRVSVWINGALHLSNTTNGTTPANLLNFSFSTGSGIAQGFASGAIFNGHYEIDNVLVQTGSDFSPPPSAYDTWAASGGLSGAQVGPGHDYLGDGMPNLLRYALGGATTTPAGTLRPVPATTMVNSVPRLAISFQRIADPSLIYEVWASGDLVDWGVAPVWSSSGAQNTAEVVVVQDPQPAGEHLCRFLRLRVTLP